MAKFAALLRGINVGGNNLIRMTDLKEAFEDLGFKDVATYIQSGNVLFSAAAPDGAEKLAVRIEKALSSRFRYPSRVVVVSRAQLRSVIDAAPKGFGSSPVRYRYDVIFLKKPLTPAKAMKSVSTRPGVDKAYQGGRVLYFSRLDALAAQSRLPKVVGTPAYQFMTIRNWNTATKLLELMEARPRGLVSLKKDKNSP